MNNIESTALITRSTVAEINRKKSLSFKSHQNIENIVSKSDLLGYNIIKLNDDLISLENDTSIILVSDKQITLDNTMYRFCDNTYGVRELRQGLFSSTVFESINFNDVDTFRVTDMTAIFECCKAKSLNLSSFNTSQVRNMQSMFKHCELETLDLSSFNTSQVANMKFMFANSTIKNLNINSFNTNRVKSMYSMFSEFRTQSLDLNSFKTSNDTEVDNMFYNCKADIKATDSNILKAIDEEEQSNQLVKEMLEAFSEIED